MYLFRVKTDSKALLHCWLSGGFNSLYQTWRCSEGSLTHCFFLVWERSCLCWATIFFISSMSSSLHFSFTCLHFLSISACVLDTALFTACRFSSSISPRNCKDDHIAEFAAIFPPFPPTVWLSWRKRGIFKSGHKREPNVSPKWKKRSSPCPEPLSGRVRSPACSPLSSFL